jgi:hypothetical protein
MMSGFESDFVQIKAFFERNALALCEKHNDEMRRIGPKTPFLLIVNTA